MILIRSIIANIFLIVSLIIVSIFLYISTFFVSRKTFAKFITNSIKIVRNISFFIAGVRLEIRGIENIPQTPCIIASKHQSAIETTFLFNTIKYDIVYAYKKEIADVPLWGRLSRKFGGVAINRGAGKGVYDVLVQEAKKSLEDGYCVAMFPEGTRVPIGKTVPLKKGVGKLYISLNVPVVPVALNTGYCYPKKSFLIRKGKIIIEFLPVIPSGLSEQDFMTKLHTIINDRSNELLKEANS